MNKSCFKRFDLGTTHNGCVSNNGGTLHYKSRSSLKSKLQFLSFFIPCSTLSRWLCAVARAKEKYDRRTVKVIFKDKKHDSVTMMK